MVRRAFGAATGWRLGPKPRLWEKKDTTSKKKTLPREAENKKRHYLKIEVVSFLKKRHN